MQRRAFIAGTGVAAAAAGLARGRVRGSVASDVPAADVEEGRWAEVRSQFRLAPEEINLGALLVASHPRPVREAIEEYRRSLDERPVSFIVAENRRRQELARKAAAEYVGGRPDEVALTESTTMGIAIVYHGLRLRPHEEVLTTEHEYYATHETLRQISEGRGASVRRVRLYEDLGGVSESGIVDRIASAVGPATRAVALTWVHSGTGLKLPVGRIAERVREANRGRDDADRILLCVDGVHGFGVEDVTMDDLGCDLFMAGCHKWLFGPRGTGIVWGRREAWARLAPTVPSFTDTLVWSAWAAGEEPEGPTTALRMSPGGFKAFEHQWALKEAFEFHREIGKDRVAARTHALARRLKEGLAAMPHVTLHTPMSDALSAGIVCFDVKGLESRAAVERLARRGVVATATPYRESHARLTPCIYNTPDEVDAALEAIRALA